jgi:membrane peptidoglycan carboxypeptidase
VVSEVGGNPNSNERPRGAAPSGTGNSGTPQNETTAQMPVTRSDDSPLTTPGSDPTVTMPKPSAGPAPSTPPTGAGARTAYEPLSGRPLDPQKLAAEVGLDAAAAPPQPAPPQVVDTAAEHEVTTDGGGPGGPGGPDGPDGPGGDGQPDKEPSGWRRHLLSLGGGSMVRRILVGGVAAVALVIVLAMVAFGIGYWRADVPQPGDMQAKQVATITMSDGTTPLAKIVPPEGNRTILPESDIPASMKDAIMAIEDRDFLTNPGFSVKGFARALWLRVPGVGGGEDAGGGSTITQQYVKNAVVGDESSLSRKWRELIISTKMSRSWSKDEIMAAYLNTIYFGRGAYGLQAAAKTYFNADAKNLTVAQAAVLAALVRGPSLYDPATSPDNAKGRWNEVLKGMVGMKTLTQEEADKTQYPKVLPIKNQGDPDVLSQGPNGLIRTQVIQELKDANISEQELNTLGLKITTTIDKNAQAAAVKEANDVLDGEPSNLRTAVVSVNPKTGGIAAYFGGNDGNGYDRVQAGLQTGSSFKVFALAAALEQGIGLNKVYSSAPFKANGITITNSDGESCGSCNLATAMKMSLNTVYYRLMMDLDGGSKAVADAAHRAGVAQSFGDIQNTLQQPDGSVQGGVVLGQYQTRPIDMASAYATFAAQGIYRKPHLVSKVVTADGRVLLDRGTDSGERKFSADVANNVTAALTPIAAYSNGNGLSGSRASAAKTGTAQYQDTGQNKDAWMVGYTPSLSTAVWVGDDKGGPIKNSYGGIIYGSGLPAQIWRKTMDDALDGTDNETFPTPGTIGGQAGIPYEAPKVATNSRGYSPSGSVDPWDDNSTGGRTIPGLPGVTIPRMPWDQPTTRGRSTQGYGQTYPTGGDGNGGSTYGNGSGNGYGSGNGNGNGSGNGYGNGSGNGGGQGTGQGTRAQPYATYPTQ